MTSFDWALKKISKLASFTTAKLVLEIGAGSFTRSAKIASCYPDKQVFAIDFQEVIKLKIPSLAILDLTILTLLLSIAGKIYFLKICLISHFLLQ